MASIVDFDTYLKEWLKKPENAAAFLNTVIGDENPKLFLLALRNVAKAWGGISLLADLSDTNKVTLYRSLSKRGNPDFKKITALLDSLGLRLTVEPVAAKQ